MSQYNEFATITLCVASQRVFIVVYFVIDSVRELLDTLSCVRFLPYPFKFTTHNNPLFLFDAK
jgi:uncharacterized membrane protein